MRRLKGTKHKGLDIYKEDQHKRNSEQNALGTNGRRKTMRGMRD